MEHTLWALALMSSSLHRRDSAMIEHRLTCNPRSVICVIMWRGEGLSHSSESFSERINVLKFSIFFLLGVIFCRVIFLQVVNGAQYKKMADNNRIVVYRQPATRGKIFDSSMNVIVNNKPSFVVLFARQTLSNDEVQSVIIKIARLLSLPTDNLAKKMKMCFREKFSLIKVAENISKYRAMIIAEKIPQLPGVVVRVEPVRVYQWGECASHIVGYVREASVDDLSATSYLKPCDIVGKAGIEKQYDEILRGTDGGSEVEVDVHGVQKKILEIVEPVDGMSVVLTVDKKVQTAISDNMRGRTGVAVAININTGEILGLTSSPEYDPNSFVSELDDWRVPYLLESKRRPLWNRVIQGQYPPGSVYKIVTAIAGLENGAITEQTVVNCQGFVELGKYKQKFRCWAREGHGNVGLTRAIAESCDIFFYETGLKLGPSKINDWAKKFGFGEKTGIDLPSEERGLVPDKLWKKTKLHQDWYDGDTVNMSVGQGYLWTTPIQVAQFIAAVANGGTVFKPYILKKIIDVNGEVKFENTPQIKRKLDIDSDHLLAVKNGLMEAVRYGTGKNARVNGLSISGKTGTAQNPQGNDHAWFACFAPSGKPKIALVVMVEHGGGGGEVAAPIAGKILADILMAEDRGER